MSTTMLRGPYFITGGYYFYSGWIVVSVCGLAFDVLGSGVTPGIVVNVCDVARVGLGFGDCVCLLVVGGVGGGRCVYEWEVRR